MSSLPASSNGVPSFVSRQDAATLMRQVNRLLNRQLSSVCQINGLKSTGVKSELQHRISQLITEAVSANDPLRFHQIRQSVLNAIALNAGSSRSSNLLLPGLTHLTANMPSSGGYSGLSNGHRTSSLPYGQPLRITFKPSPFYHFETTIGDARTCEAMSQHRNSVTIPIKLNDHAALQQCVNDKAYRVMVFCAGDFQGIQEVAFPHQSELRVNGGEIKANLRGLKNKPGSTRPVDITSHLRLRPNYPNNLEFTYALTQKKFYLVLNICKVVSVDDLVSRIRNGHKIPKDSVLRDLNKKAQDPDVVATSQVLSLKCPLTYMRLGLPCRGLGCSHIQCFDATSYLQLQEQGPQWLCPICNKSAPFEQLAVDEYVRDILEKTSSHLESVTIEPDGRWHTKETEEERNSQKHTNGVSFAADDDDDDDLEISEVNVIGGGHRFETPKMPTPSTSTPASGGRDSSSIGPRGIASTSAKRPAPAVIDLTLSSDDDDDDELIQRPTKRQNTSMSGFSGSSNHMGYMSDQHLGFPS